MQLPASQSPDTVGQSQTTVRILHPTQVVMFYGDSDRKVIPSQDFQLEKTERELLTNLCIATLPKHMDSLTERTKE